MPISFANIYFVGRPGGSWVLVDAGVPGYAGQILAAAEARFGAGARPEAILLTHGHFDHVGSAEKLAEKWDVPIYAHRLELPYLTGQSAFPPPDPTVGGAMAFLSRFIPARGCDLRPRVHELRANQLPGISGWEWLATPGHSPGHVSFFRPSDRVLLAGDAFATMNMDRWSGLISGEQVLSRAGAPFNVDWQATRASVKELAKLRPNVAGCGHGIPLCNADLPARMEAFAEKFRPPRHGRYVRKPARTDEAGIISLPRAPFDPLPFATAAAIVMAGIALGAGYLDDKRRH